MNKAILIPANPNRPFVSGAPEGSIPARLERISEAGAVFWRLLAPGEMPAGEFPHPEIQKGYIYDVSEGWVTHSCKIEWIKPMTRVS